MKKILHIISSPRGEASYSIKLGNAIIKKIESKYPESTLIEKNLVTSHFPHLEEAHLASFFTAPEKRTAEEVDAVRHSDDSINDILEADIIIIGAPMYNFNIHSSLKAWIDHIARAGITFRYGERGPEGLIHNKKIYIALASGGVYSAGEMQAYDFVSPYITAVLSFLGMKDITIVRVEGTALPSLKDEALQKAISSIEV